MLQMRHLRFGLRTLASAAASNPKMVSPKTQALLDRCLRVDHAGEFGAVRIYEGQIAVLGRTSVGALLEVCR